MGVPPGDMTNENERALTFLFFPNHVDLDILELAKYGFYYTGFRKGEVKCFSCGNVWGDWTLDDRKQQAPFRHWHLPGCHVTRQSVDHPIRTQENISPNSPSNTAMSSKAARLKTFGNGRWKRKMPSKEDLADAGFYHFGPKDLVKCWYCNGGIHHWIQGDSPWEEHAKWFPKCGFVKREKGDDFAQQQINCKGIRSLGNCYQVLCRLFSDDRATTQHNNASCPRRDGVLHLTLKLSARSSEYLARMEKHKVTTPGTCAQSDDVIQSPICCFRCGKFHTDRNDVTPPDDDVTTTSSKSDLMRAFVRCREPLKELLDLLEDHANEDFESIADPTDSYSQH